MADPEVTCPHCRVPFKLNQSLAAPLIEATRQDYEGRLAEQREVMRRHNEALQAEKAKLDTTREGIAAQVAEQVTSKLETETARITAAARQQAQERAAADLRERDQQLADLKEVVEERDRKLAEAQQAQADLIKARRELDDQKRELALTVEKQVQEGLGEVRAKAVADAEASMSLKVREKEEQIAGMGRQIDDLKRKVEQGSQQLQGEVQELVLEERLREMFPRDQIVPVAKGTHGGDCLQHVLSQDGQIAGSILWESKRTRTWSDGWLAKLRGDQRAAKADIAMCMSQTLPQGLEHFDLLEGVWVTHPRCAFAVATALRESLIAVAGARRAGEGQETKTQMIYAYLTGPRFKHHVEAIVDQFGSMQADLERERRTTMRGWAKREGQIRNVVDATATMWGDLQGIAGASLQEIEGLDTLLLDGPVEDEE